MVTVHLFENSDGTYDLALMGSGATADFDRPLASEAASLHPLNYEPELDKRAYKDKLSKVKNIFIQKGVTSIGSYLLALCTNAEKIIFEDPASITHLGDYAFGCCHFEGELKFPALTDTVLAPAFNGCTRLKALDFTGSSLTEISERALEKCIGLQKISGMDKVQSVGEHAFLMCPELVEADFAPSALKSVGEEAFNVCSLNWDGDWTATSFGKASVPKVKFDEDTLKAIREVPPVTVDLSPSRNESQLNYMGLPHSRSLYSGTVESYDVATSGCASFAAYHAYNAYHENRGDGKACERYQNYYDDVLRKTAKTDVTDWISSGKIAPEYIDGAEVKDGRYYFFFYDFPHGSFEHEREGEEWRRLGWRIESGGGYEGVGTMYAHGAEAKMRIINELKAGRPVLVAMCKTAWTVTQHMVCIVGMTDDDRFIVVDSSPYTGNKAAFYRCAFEVLFAGETVTNSEGTIPAQNYIVCSDFGEASGGGGSQ